MEDLHLHIPYNAELDVQRTEPGPDVTVDSRARDAHKDERLGKGAKVRAQHSATASTRKLLALLDIALDYAYEYGVCAASRRSLPGFHSRHHLYCGALHFRRNHTASGLLQIRSLHRLAHSKAHLSLYVSYLCMQLAAQQASRLGSRQRSNITFTIFFSSINIISTLFLIFS